MKFVIAVVISCIVASFAPILGFALAILAFEFV